MILGMLLRSERKLTVEAPASGKAVNLFRRDLAFCCDGADPG